MNLNERQIAHRVLLPLRLKVVVCDRTNDGFGAEFLADTPDEKRELGLFRQFLRAAATYTDAWAALGT